VRRTSTWASRLRPLSSWPLGGQAALELGDDLVYGGQILDGAGRERPVELGQRALGREARRALDQVAFELAAQVLLEFSELVAWQTVVSRVLLWEIGLGLGAETERAPDPLHVDAQDAGALAAAERGDGQAGQISEGGVRSVSHGGRSVV
jgi:hypothetical protein